MSYSCRHTAEKRSVKKFQWKIEMRKWEKRHNMKHSHKCKKPSRAGTCREHSITCQISTGIHVDDLSAFIIKFISKHNIVTVNVTSNSWCSSCLPAENIRLNALRQLSPWQFVHAVTHHKLFFLHMHLADEMTLCICIWLPKKGFYAAGGTSIITGINASFLHFHSQA